MSDRCDLDKLGQKAGILRVESFCQFSDRCLPPMHSIEEPSIEKRVAKIFATYQITRKDQQMLMALFSKGKISPTNEALINKIFEALRAGCLRVVE